MLSYRRSTICSRYVGIMNSSQTNQSSQSHLILQVINLNTLLKTYSSNSQQSSIFQINCQEAETTEFAPHVSATCKAGVMNIKVAFNGSYTGTVHARDYRNSNCMVVGDGSSSVSLSLNMLAKQGQTDFCGILVSNVNAEVSWINFLKTNFNFTN